MLFFIQYSWICPPAAKATILHFNKFADSKIVQVSSVLPETLIGITNVLESTVDGK